MTESSRLISFSDNVCPTCGLDLSDLSTWGIENHVICCRNYCKKCGKVSIPISEHNCSPETEPASSFPQYEHPQGASA